MKQLLASELEQFILTHPNTVLLDVRQDEEHQWCAIPNSLLIPLNELPLRSSELDHLKHNPIVVYCKAGVRSQFACEILTREGFGDLYNLADGIIGWQNTQTT